ncbi:uncharacterized protein LOC142775060 [Rhipicephalus microplus]|uniref:uncharacterized protein LOC142775060 n=1 Tax=Rhipicephalus microplus TaxID=6941 RepID=UPI003F6B8C0F
MLLRNPFLFFVQAVVFASSTSHGQAECSVLPDNEDWHRGSWNMDSSKCCFNDELLGMRSWLPQPAAQLSTTSITSAMEESINRLDRAIFTSGHGGSSANMLLRNPFLFFVQAVVFASSTSHGQAECSVLPDNEDWHRGSWNMDSSKCCFNDELLGMRSWLPQPAAQLSTTSITSAMEESINRLDRAIFTSGHGGSSANMLLRNPFLFFVQVRDDRNLSCYRDDNVCLVLLLCPRSLLLAYCAVYECLVDLLSSCGDVEPNPGPTTEAILKTSINDIRELKDSSSAVNQQLSKTVDTLTSIEKKKKLDDLSQTVASNTTNVDDLQKQVDGLTKKIDDLENCSRRNNMLIFGVTEENDADQPLGEQVAKGILEDIIQVPNVAIERIHRIGKPVANTCRPVNLKLVDGRDKTRILKNCGNLKGTEFSISEDFSPRVQQIRKKLWASPREERSSGAKVALIFDKIKVNGKLYRWDD